MISSGHALMVKCVLHCGEVVHTWLQDILVMHRLSCMCYIVTGLGVKIRIVCYVNMQKNVQVGVCIVTM